MENELATNLEELKNKVWVLAMQAKENSEKAAKRFDELCEYEKENKLTTRQNELKELNNEEKHAEYSHYLSLFNIWMDVVYISEEKKHGLEF